MNPVELWNGWLGPEERSEAAFTALAARMREARLVFGGRVHCPFLRPFFLSESDLGRIAAAAEPIARIGERVIDAALASPTLLAEFGLTEEEDRLVRIEPGYHTASTASRLDAFLLPDSLMFAEYNAESPAGPGYAEVLGEIFREQPIMSRLDAMAAVRGQSLSGPLLDALIASYRDWGGTVQPPTIAIVDWRDVPTWSEFQILQERFEARGVPTVVCDPRDLEIARGRLLAEGRPVDLVYRRVLMNDVVSRADECRALVTAYAQQLVCVANTFRCKIPHKKSLFAVLTDERHASLFGADEQATIRAHVPWTRVVAERRTRRADGRDVELVEHVRRDRERFVLKPTDEYGGTGVTLGWETDESGWDDALARALAARPGTWIAQERIPIRREVFPAVDTAPHRVTMKEMLVDLAPYLFRGKVAGFLTRLSSTGLANVTSGGGQVPCFVVSPR
jgi:Circularly permuted ATP-grasp type 2